MYVSNVHSPVAMYVISDYKIHKNDLTDLSGFKKNSKIFMANIKIPFTFTIMEFTT